MTPAIELRGIEKRFGATLANAGVCLAVPQGVIAGIVGENGAGKTTAMSIVYGMHQPDAGEILIDGMIVRHDSPADAIANRVGMVHQHFMLVETFTVLENVVLGAEQGPLIAAGLHAARAELTRLAAEYGLSVPLDAKIRDLPVGMQQRVEILKALYRGARILILDEPTAVLTPQETDQFFAILRSLKDKGATIILISHKLKEIMAATDQVFVMRAGKVVAERATAATTRDELAELMVGDKSRIALAKSEAQPGAPVLRVEGLGLEEGGVARLADVSFALYEGEIVGIAGVAGNGQSELLEILAGITAPSAGRIDILGRTLTPDHPADPATLRALGLAHVPEDRLKFAMAAAFTAEEVGILGRQRRSPFTRANGLLDPQAIRGHCAALMQAFDVRPPLPEQPAGQFSGGNQQKLVIARELADSPKILLAGQPTRGVDIGAIADIHAHLLRLREAGGSVLLVSVELEEILKLSDRILVMYGGRIVGEIAGRGADERQLGRMMAGIAPDGRKETA